MTALENHLVNSPQGNQQLDSPTVQPNTEGKPPVQPVTYRFWACVEVVSVLAVCFAYAGQIAPNVNETHYLAKAKHFWNPEWCPSDLFLSSSNPHLLFYAAFGWLTIFFSLTTVAWIGRVVCWLLFALSWRSLSEAATGRCWLAPITALTFLLLLHQCHLAGEWIIGGVESKGFAFAFVFWAIAAMLKSQWSRAWLMFGVASAFHVLVGGWSCLAAMIAFLVCRLGSKDLPDWKSQVVPLIVGGGISLIGVLPPLLANWTTDSETVHQANVILVTQRLGHHQWFGDFATSRVAWFGVLVFGWLLIDRTVKHPNHLKPLRYFAIASLAICLAGIGLSSQLEIESNSRAADFLIYYWFRLSDFAIPLVATFALVTCIQILGKKYPFTGAITITSALISVGLFATVCSDRWNDERPIAVQRSLYSYEGQPKRTLETYENWRVACEWIRANTPKDAAFLTPARQQTFKWYAQRREIISWKDIPQDAAGILKWYERVQRLYRVELSYTGGLWAYSDQQLTDIAHETGATHIVSLQSDLDSRSEPPPKFRQIYPLDPNDKATFVVFELE